MLTKPYHYYNIKVGDKFFFGTYPQGSNGEVSPILWRVLARENDRMLVIAEYGLDCKKYNEQYEATNWSQCTLRIWLNSEFKKKAFTVMERIKLKSVKLTNPNCYTDCGLVTDCSDTLDTVFLLSKDEALHYLNQADSPYFFNQHDLCCRATDYGGMRQEGAYYEPYRVNCRWWLRSSSDIAYRAELVGSDGSFDHDRVSNGNGVVRPAVWLAL